MPKLGLAKNLAEIRAQLLAAGATLVRSGRLETVDDVWFLRVDELLAALNDPAAAPGADIAERRVTFRRHAAMRAPL